ncbi:MAG: NnrU family protein, partial [Deltaproteobacteria bacterium]|nr:NnrU family protein [Deltaproteobacteria bacterium]
MGIFVIGLIIFFGIHSISIVNEPWRDRMVDQIGKWPWKGLYSLVAIFGFILMIWG